MKARSFVVSFVSLVSIVGLAIGCSQAAPLGESSSSASTSAHSASALVAELERGGTYMFDLEASPRAAALARAKCTFSERACLQDIANEAAKEGVRFSKTKNDELLFTSFGEGETFLETTFEVLEATDRSAVVSSHGKTIRLELDADGRLAMIDPLKGRLVYRRAE
jgi:hypothetical protein